MTFIDAAAEVLRLVGRPLHFKQITEFAIEKNLLSHVGKSPENMMGVRLSSVIKKDDSPLIRVKPGVFALREWDEKTIKAGLDQSSNLKAPPGLAAAGNAAAEPVDAPAVAVPVELDPDDAPLITNMEEDDDEESRVTLIPTKTTDAAKQQAAEIPPPPRAAKSRPAQIVEDDDIVDGPEDAMRAELVAAAADVFDEEEDDDQPILGGDGPAGEGGGDAAGGDGRRRRRRRRRGRGGADSGQGVSAQGLPSYTAVPVDDRRPQHAQGGGRDERGGNRDGRDRDRDRDDRRERDDRPSRTEVIDFLATDGPQLDDLSGREFSDAVYSILSTFDRGNGPVSLRQIAETVQRKGRLAGDGQMAQSQVAAAVRADNQKRLAQGQRPRFRFAGGRVGLTDWLLGSELASLEHEAVQAVERYREAARRAFARKLTELPGHAFVELSVLVLEKLGLRELRALRRPGAPGFEAHFSAVLKTPLESIRVAVVIRRDGREVGRERVSELRGTLHHYQGAASPAGATMGFIFTAGQVLSGAREEASATGVPAIALYDGAGVARLCEEHEVAVVTARMPIAIPDVDLLEALRAS